MNVLKTSGRSADGRLDCEFFDRQKVQQHDQQAVSKCVNFGGSCMFKI